MRGVLLGSHNLCKLPTGGLPELTEFRDALPPELAAKVEFSEELPDEWMEKADAVIVFGRDEVIAEFRRQHASAPDVHRARPQAQLRHRLRRPAARVVRRRRARRVGVRSKGLPVAADLLREGRLAHLRHAARDRDGALQRPESARPAAAERIELDPRRARRPAISHGRRRADPALGQQRLDVVDGGVRRLAGLPAVAAQSLHLRQAAARRLRRNAAQVRVRT